MRVALVGTGRIGAEHAGVLRRHPAVASLVVADADPSRARAVARKLGVRAADTVAGALDGIDALVVTTATAAHADLVLRGVRAGIPVFCEKPVAADLAASRAVLAEVEKSGVPVQIGHQRRFDAGYRAVREALQAGRLGELRRVHLVSADSTTPPAEFIRTSGGIFRDCHVHDLDVLRWVTGREVVQVYAVGAARGASYVAEAGDVDESAAVLTLDDGTVATMAGSRCNGGGYDVRMEVAGTAGTFVVGLDARSPLVSAEPGQTFPDGQPWAGFWERFAPAYAAEINAFCELALGRGENHCTVADAVAALLVAEAADLSRAERRPVDVEEVRSA